MYNQRNMKKFIAIFLIIFTLNSYASDCSDSFDNNLINIIIESEMREGIQSDINIFKDQITDSVSKKTSIHPESEHFDTFTRDSIVLISLQEVKKVMENIDNDLEQQSEKIDNLIMTITHIINNNPELKQTHLLNKFQEAKNENIANKLVASLFKNGIVKIFEEHIEELNTELAKHANREIDSRFDIEESKKDFNLGKDFLNMITEEPSIGPTIAEAEAFIKNHSSQQQLPLAHKLISNIQKDATVRVAIRTSIDPESIGFDVFTRDKLMLIMLQEVKKALQGVPSILKQTSAKLDSLTIKITHIINDKPELKQPYLPEALLEAKNKIEGINLKVNEGTKVIEEHIKELSTELAKPENKNKQVNGRFDLEEEAKQMKEVVTSEAIVKQRLEDLYIDQIIDEAESFIEQHSSSEQANQEDQAQATPNSTAQAFERIRNNITEYNDTPEGKKNPIDSIASYDLHRHKLPQDEFSGKSSSFLRKKYKKHISKDGTGKGFSNSLIPQNT